MEDQPTQVVGVLPQGAEPSLPTPQAYLSDIIEINGSKFMPLRLADKRKFRKIAHDMRLRDYVLTGCTEGVELIEKQLIAEMKLIKTKVSELSRTQRDQTEQTFKLMFLEIGSFKTK